MLSDDDIKYIAEKVANEMGIEFIYRIDVYNGQMVIYQNVGLNEKACVNDTGHITRFDTYGNLAREIHIDNTRTLNNHDKSIIYELLKTNCSIYPSNTAKTARVIDKIYNKLFY